MTVDTETFLNEIEAENPCGEDLEYDADFIALEQAIKGKPEHQMGDVIQEAEPPNWKEVRNSAEQLLTRTRDLRVLMFYLQALVALEGFPGFAAGMQLIHKLNEAFWPHLYPQLDPDDDNDPTERVNILMALCDYEILLRPLQRLPLIESKAFGKFSFRDIQIAEGQIQVSDPEGETVELSSISGAIQDCDSGQLKTTSQALSESLEYLDALENFVTDQVGVANAPSFSELRDLLKEIHTVFSQWLEKRGLDEAEENPPGAETDETEPGSTPVKASGVMAGSAIRNNEDIIKTLQSVCHYYRSHEPSSPIPILLERVIRLVGKDFLEIMKDMAPDGVDQVEFLRGSPSEQPVSSDNSSSSGTDEKADGDYNY